MIRRYLPKSTEELIHWYERYISPLALLFGFLLDNFIFLDRVDSLQSYIFITAYMVLAAFGIALLHIIERGKIKHRFALAIAPFLPVVIQFAFGALFSGFLAVYWRSATVAVSWIFVIAIAALLLGNERFRAHYVKLPFQTGVYFVVLFSFFIFLLPILFHRVGPSMFILSGLLSLAVIVSLLYVLFKFVPEVIREEKTKVARSIAAIFILFNVLYFSNAIPPLPLALKEAGVYHAVRREGDTYVLSAEPLSWYKRYLLYNTEFHRAPGESAYVFSAIYAPAGLRTTIIHQWQKKNSEGGWQTESTVPFTISGGREGGYRAYSIKHAVSEGDWRVNVLTKSGQVVGRVAFSVLAASSSPATEEVRR